jgi:drug/metabolite transporter (DMT)-like permease
LTSYRGDARHLTTSHSPVGDNVRLAVASILAGNLAFSLGDAAVKSISADLVLWQIFVTRSIIVIPLLIGIIFLQFGPTSLAPRHFGWVALRSLMLTLMLVAYLSSLPHLALGVAAVTFYTLPIFITLFAALFIGDKIGLIGWASVLMGFAGVVLILKPTPDGFNRYALLPLVSAILYALTAILTRTKCREEHPLVLSLGANLSIVVIGLLATLLVAMVGEPSDEAQKVSFLFGEWSAMGVAEWLTIGFPSSVGNHRQHWRCVRVSGRSTRDCGDLRFYLRRLRCAVGGSILRRGTRCRYTHRDGDDHCGGSFGGEALSPGCPSAGRVGVSAR